MRMKIFQGILVSCNRYTERACIAEISYTLSHKLGIKKSEYRSHLTGISGLVSIAFKELNPLELVRRMAELEDEEEYYVHTLKIKPVQRSLDADYESMKEVISELVKDMEGSYRITINKRHTSMKKDILIDAAASIIENPVNLHNYDWELLIEVIGDKMGLSAVRRGGIYSTKKAYETNSKDDWFLDE